ncbi:MAG TPA: hypothetical protein VFV34_28785, partial [Blastocatellia bacterium]|nr:hypothetical protein [Blastocatellia bacterium]
MNRDLIYQTSDSIVLTWQSDDQITSEKYPFPFFQHKQGVTLEIKATMSPIDPGQLLKRTVDLQLYLTGKHAEDIKVLVEGSDLEVESVAVAEFSTLSTSTHCHNLRLSLNAFERVVDSESMSV